MTHSVEHNGDHQGQSLIKIALGAIGVVYGDIGTSPLYAVKECFHGAHAVPVTEGNVLGILSLIFWSLTVVVVVKYLAFVMRADNHGEGGMMALLALLADRTRGYQKRGFRRMAVILLALFGTALLLADGMITPAISVLSAVEGLEIATPIFQSWVVPLTIVILFFVFISQKSGTARVAAIFGPATCIWFVTIGILGLRATLQRPDVLAALNPWQAVQFFVHNGYHGFTILGSVVLCITGAEALYADMGHFGLRPIRLAWYTVVFPALLLNYLGQGALLLEHGAAVASNPFYALAPRGFLYPLVGIATMATVIASQALISGAFSIAQQAVQLGYCPRLHIVHTSSETAGQIYVPSINTLLLVSCCSLVFAFKSSSNLAAAYGIAVMGTMTITTILLYAVMRQRWSWSVPKAGVLALVFLGVEIPFVAANLSKVVHGGWFPLAMGAALFVVMTTWKRGRSALGQEMKKRFVPLGKFMQELESQELVRVKGTAVFMTANRGIIPPVLLHHITHNKVLHEQVVLLRVMTDTVPNVPKEDRLEVREVGMGVFEVVAHYGFMETPHVPHLLRHCRKSGLYVNAEETTYYLGRETLLTSGQAAMSRWRKALFAFLSRNARPATSFFGIPPSRVVELGSQIEL